MPYNTGSVNYECSDKPVKGHNQGGGEAKAPVGRNSTYTNQMSEKDASAAKESSGNTYGPQGY
jgi:hypothetical protein